MYDLLEDRMVRRARRIVVMFYRLFNYFQRYDITCLWIAIRMYERYEA